jgi:hypothetical protein
MGACRLRSSCSPACKPFPTPPKPLPPKKQNAPKNPTHLPLSCTAYPASLRPAAAVASVMAPLTAAQSDSTRLMPFLVGRSSPAFCGWYFLGWGLQVD